MKYYELYIYQDKNTPVIKSKKISKNAIRINGFYQRNLLNAEILHDKNIIAFPKNLNVDNDFTLIDYLLINLISEKIYLHYREVLDEDNFIKINISKDKYLYALVPYAIQEKDLNDYVRNAIKNNNLKEIFYYQNRFYISEKFKNHFEKHPISFIKTVIHFNSEKLDIPYILLLSEEYGFDLTDHSNHFDIIEKELSFVEGIDILEKNKDNIDLLTLWKKGENKEYALIYDRYIIYYNVFKDKYEFDTSVYLGKEEDMKQGIFFKEQFNYMSCNDFDFKGNIYNLPESLKNKKWSLALKNPESDFDLF